MKRTAWLLAFLLAGRGTPHGICAADGALEFDPRLLVSRADLAYDSPAARSEEGLPIGNGRMGTLVWTIPAALKFQINRVDVFPIGCASNSFPERHTDYCGGCGAVDIAFPEYGANVFPEGHTRQHLSCYDGLAAVEGVRVDAGVLAWNEKDVMAVRITDRRENPGSVVVRLGMLRPPFVRRGSHTATSSLVPKDGRIVLTQEFVEDGHFCGTAVAVAVVGRASEIRQESGQTLQLVVEPKQGSFTVLVASAASFDRRENTAASALAQLEAAAAAGFSRLAESNRAWWHAFWENSYIRLHSEDGVADGIEKHYTYYLYLMGSSSRGKYPAKFNGMLWTTDGDTRKWGAHFWGANQSCLYNNTLFAAGHAELMDPLYGMVTGMAKACSLAARQQWDSRGIFIPETLAFDGLAPLPEGVAAEMRDLYLLRKPWESRSRDFLEYAGTKQPHSSRWNWIQSGTWDQGRWTIQERGSGPYGPVTHIFSRGAKIAYQYWMRYEYTLDETWLRDRAYPMLKGAAEFYRNYPNVKKEADGKYHIHHVNSNEPLWGGKDTDEEIASMMGIFPVVIRASQILGVDAGMRPLWTEFLNHLAPLPRSDHPEVTSGRPSGAPPVWIKALHPIVRGRGASLPDGNTMPMWFFDLCTLESDSGMRRTANATFDAFFPSGFGSDRRGVGVLSKLPLAAAILGRTEAVRRLIPDQLLNPETPAMANRMDLREGEQTTSAQRLGNAADALHTALCHDLPPGPGRPPVIRVFPAWPEEWDAEFALLCRGGFRVHSAMQKGRIDFVEILSRAGGQCRLRNPWGDGKTELYRNGKKAESLNGLLLSFRTTQNEGILLVRAGSGPDRITRPSSERSIRP